MLKLLKQHVLILHRRLVHHILCVIDLCLYACFYRVTVHRMYCFVAILFTFGERIFLVIFVVVLVLYSCRDSWLIPCYRLELG